MNNIERRYLNNLDQPNQSEIERQGLLAEETVANFFNTSESGFKARLSTPEEDSGVKDIGAKATIDVVAYREGKPAFGIQVTSALDKNTQKKKMLELQNRPFIRIPEMKPKDSAIPKTLVFLDRGELGQLANPAEIQQHPEVAIKILDGIILSLKFDLSQTKNPHEIKSVQTLIFQIEQEKKRLIS